MVGALIAVALVALGVAVFVGVELRRRRSAVEALATHTGITPRRTLLGHSSHTRGTGTRGAWGFEYAFRSAGEYNPSTTAIMIRYEPVGGVYRAKVVCESTKTRPNGTFPTELMDRIVALGVGATVRTATATRQPVITVEVVGNLTQPAGFDAVVDVAVAVADWLRTIGRSR